MIEVLNSTQPKARVSHMCGHCSQPILPGTTYQRTVCVDSGDIWAFKSHQACDDLYNVYAQYYALDEYDVANWFDVLEWDAERRSANPQASATEP